MKKIYFIEGLPGSGKTTMAKKFANHLVTKNYDAVFYQEGDLHPVDLAWIAILEKNELNSLIERYPSLRNDILFNLKEFNEKYHLAYTQVKINLETKDFYDYCLKYEIYQSEDYNYFLDEHLLLWNEFIEERLTDDKIYVFECIFLQNHINELLLKYDMSIEGLRRYFKKFSEVLKGIDVEVIYIKQLNVSDTLKRITEERRTNDKTLYKDWIDHVIEYFESSRYGKLKGYVGYEGALRYFTHRQDIELDVIKSLSINSRIIELDNDYESVFKDIIKSFRV